MRPTHAMIGGGEKLHLQHGPIDLIIGADGDREAAFSAAKTRFDTVLDELVTELPELRKRLTLDTPRPVGDIAQTMHLAALPFTDVYVTRMAAVAGAVADAVLKAMVRNADLTRAYVNNGGDIALYLAKEQGFTAAISAHNGNELGRVEIRHSDPARGIATSGRHGRSHSLGIADSVTVVACSAAQADVAATLIANAIDLPGHSAISRKPACDLDDMSDLEDQLVVTGVDRLTEKDMEKALGYGAACAADFLRQGLIFGASLHLGTQLRTVGAVEELEHA